MEKLVNITRVAGIILLITIGLNGIIAGVALMIHPNGDLIGLSKGILRYSPFDDFLIPGIFLLILNGICNILVAVLTAAKHKYYSRLITMQGIVLILWLILQLAFLRNGNSIQLLMLALGVALIVIGEFINTKTQV